MVYLKYNVPKSDVMCKNSRVYRTASSEFIGAQRGPTWSEVTCQRTQQWGIAGREATPDSAGRTGTEAITDTKEKTEMQGCMECTRNNVQQGMIQEYLHQSVGIYK